MDKFYTILLLIISNLFMTYAWYGHLKHFQNKALWFVILISWGVAFFEYCFQVPGNRLGIKHFSLPELKILQEVITLVVFMLFSVFVMNLKPQLNFLYAGICLVGAVYFIFKG